VERYEGEFFRGDRMGMGTCMTLRSFSPLPGRLIRYEFVQDTLRTYDGSHEDAPKGHPGSFTRLITGFWFPVNPRRSPLTSTVLMSWCSEPLLTRAAL
jgi:hypothetical protein